MTVSEKLRCSGSSAPHRNMPSVTMPRGTCPAESSELGVSGSAVS
jgi:hypothetical protein